jgi:hypothetical protein
MHDVQVVDVVIQLEQLLSHLVHYLIVVIYAKYPFGQFPQDPLYR